MLFKSLFFLFFVVLVDRCNGLGYVYWTLPFNWSYAGDTGPRHWVPLGYKECGGTSQSPNNLNLQKVQHIQNNIILSNYEKTPQLIHIENIGDTVKFSMSTTHHPNITFTDSHLTYVFDNGHFHWGSSDNVGSEHHINGRAFPMEAHLVHRNSIYGSVDEAAGQPHGLVVLSTFYDIHPDPKYINPDLKDLLHDVRHVKYADDTYNDSRPFSLQKMLPDLTSGGSYFTYNGSLTTPPCHQSVRWVILDNPVKIGKKQMDAFRQLQTRPKRIDHFNNHPLVDNFRPTQLLNSRNVYWSNLPKSWN